MREGSLSSHTKCLSKQQPASNVWTDHKVGLLRAGRGYNWDTMEEPICLHELEVKAKCKNPYCNSSE